jgi:hypothetical protein
MNFSGIVTMDEEAMAAYHSFYERYPAFKVKRQLLIDIATEKGGLTLQIWQLLHGPDFGLNHRMTTTAAARELGVPVATVDALAQETWDVVTEKWSQYPGAAAARAKLRAAVAAGTPSPDCR